jgi:hypothetical protein
MQTVSAVTAGIQQIAPIDSILAVFNSNPYFIGLMMLILNLGGRFLALEVTKEQEKFFQHPLIRRILIFVVLFVATRNVWVAFWSTVVIVLFLGYLLNENSALCLFKSDYAIGGASCSKSAGPGAMPGLTPEEQEILRRLKEKEARYATPVANKESVANKDSIGIVEKYMGFMSRL